MSMKNNERDCRAARQVRSVSQRFETRETDSELWIEGYFAVFNSPYRLWEGAEEIVRPGAFTGCLDADIRALTDHEPRLVLGRTTANTLYLVEDEHGLFGRIKVNRNDADAMNLYARVQRGDVNQCSFGFEIERETFVDLGGGRVCWEIEKVNPLYEVSVVTFPAYEETAVKARHADFEEQMRRRASAWRNDMRKRIRMEENSNGT